VILELLENLVRLGFLELLEHLVLLALLVHLEDLQLKDLYLRYYHIQLYRYKHHEHFHLARKIEDGFDTRQLLFLFLIK
jgi:hypothetical protein